MHRQSKTTPANPGAGTLHVVATPIGNLGDLTPRARDVLAGAGLIAAEDTRHTGRLLTHLGIDRPMLSLHEHNEETRVAEILARLRGGEDVALVSDAGTPLVSDPGYRLLAAVRAAGLRASPVPGPSALLAALCVSGLPTDRFCFAGFLPARSGARRAMISALAGREETLVFFTGIRRLAQSLADLAAGLGEREATVARELTKLHETVTHGTLRALHARLLDDPQAAKGEAVIVVAGAKPAAGSMDEALRIARILAESLPISQAAALTARICDVPRREIYQRLQSR